MERPAADGMAVVPGPLARCPWTLRGVEATDATGRFDDESR